MIKEQIRTLVKRHPGLQPSARFFLDLSFQCRTLLSRLTRRSVIRRYLESHQVRGLHLGCGANLIPGWLNTELTVAHAGAVFLDATRPFPLPDNSMDFVFSEHMIEHVPHAQGMNLLRESFRVLKPGGHIRIATPDLAVILGLLSAEPNTEASEYVQWFRARHLHDFGGAGAASVINCFFYSWGHRFIYDRFNLETSFRSAGFADLEWRIVGESAHEGLRNLEHHGDASGSPRWNIFETMILEGRKPTA
jgi:predicted SAM-dependent methyltransferase